MMQPVESPWTKRAAGKDREFLCDEDIRSGINDAKPGFFIRLRLPSYRSLPLSCIERIELSLDGEVVDPESMALIVGGYSHRLGELRRLSKIFWWVLDPADLFIERQEPLAGGDHTVEGAMVTVEPYMTVGRFPIFYPCKRRLRVAVDPWEA